jgi:hypothetical protein
MIVEVLEDISGAGRRCSKGFKAIKAGLLAALSLVLIHGVARSLKVSAGIRLSDELVLAVGLTGFCWF